ncbi:MAG: MJ1477/TM1410 family putative glycoside hydrolase [Candidatus Heimdallarchaeaceae archaeon]
MKKFWWAVIVLIILLGAIIPAFYFAEKREYETLISPTFYLNGYIVKDFGYQLQNVNIEEISASRYDLLIIDYSSDGSEEGEYSSLDLDKMREGHDKILLGYISIGEAEDYRFYWKENWDANHDGNPDSGAPQWLDEENPDWEGNYKVKYWQKEWQRIIFGENNSYLDRIILAGFDGCYMDIVDAFEYYEDKYDFAREEMINFVVNISTYAKQIDENFLIFAQNGEALLNDSRYRNSLDGFGREDVFYNDNWKKDNNEIEEILLNLDKLYSEGKAVFIIDYPTRETKIYEVYKNAFDVGYLAYVGPRELDELRYYSFFSV